MTHCAPRFCSNYPATISSASKHPSCTYMSLSEGPMKMAAKIPGVEPGLKPDNAPYFTNNEGIPWSDPAHFQNVGDLPLVSDPFLVQKQQIFNRSKTLERMDRLFLFPSRADSARLC
ncbi:hypothetical protein AN958_00215 [Leucoagaricus sp. SymC.cos]|nr:hypothetical protein AN958_00215 [Leucoagaricus sp. SymC.cos]